MPKRTKNNKPPKYSKLGKYAVVYYNRKPVYLGIYGSEESHVAYARFVAESRSDPVFRSTTEVTEIAVRELALAFLDYAKVTYDHSGYLHYRIVINDFLLKLYGDLAVNGFKPSCLKVIRSEMILSGRYCRNTINDHTGRITRIFAWGHDNDFVDERTVDALQKVRKLRKGEWGTFDHPDRKFVDDDAVRRTLPFMVKTIATMVQIQRMTGMRPSELCKMTVGDISRTRGNGLWYYTLKARETEQIAHKTEEASGKKIIPLSKPVQELLLPFLQDKKPTAAVFSPRTAMQEKKERQRKERKTPMTPSQIARDKKRAETPYAKTNEFYDRNSYRKAIAYAIKRANKNLPPEQQIPHWFPYQIRHSTSTAIEITEGLDKSQAVLGHRSPNTTRRYSHGQLKLAEEVARKQVNPFETE